MGTKHSRYRRRNALGGLCPRCGKPCAPYSMCEYHRLRQNERAKRRRAARGYIRGPHHDHASIGPRIADTAECRKCNKPFGRTAEKAAAYVTICQACFNAYRQELRRRVRSGEDVGGPPCSICGKRTHAKNTSGVHQACVWTETLNARAEALAKQRQEWEHPTEEETWLRKSRKYLRDARILVASRSRMPASQPEKTSPS